MNSKQVKIIKEAKRIEEDSLHSSKAHFYAAQFWKNLHLFLGVPSALFAGIAGVSFLYKIDSTGISIGILAIVAATLSSIATFLNPNEKSNNHLEAGNEYNRLRNRARILYEIEINEINQSDLTKKIKDLDKKRNKLNQKSIQIPKWAHKKAKKGIEKGEARYQIDKD